MDPYKLTRRKYREELKTPIPGNMVHLLAPHRDEVLKTFREDTLVEYANRNPGVWESIKDSSFKSVSGAVSVYWFRIFVLQTKYPEIVRSDQVVQIADSGDEVLLHNGVSSPLRRPTFATVDMISIPTHSKPPLREPPLGDFFSLSSNQLTVRRCLCPYDFGGVVCCECLSVENQFVVPYLVERSRRSLEGESEFLVSWRPYASGRIEPSCWIPRTPLSLWACKSYVVYLESRCVFPIEH